MMSISRRCLDGTKQPDETLNKGELYIKNSVTIEKSIEVNPLNCGKVQIG